MTKITLSIWSNTDIRAPLSAAGLTPDNYVTPGKLRHPPRIAPKDHGHHINSESRDFDKFISERLTEDASKELIRLRESGKISEINANYYSDGESLYISSNTLIKINSIGASIDVMVRGRSD